MFLKSGILRTRAFLHTRQLVSRPFTKAKDFSRIVGDSRYPGAYERVQQPQTVIPASAHPQSFNPYAMYPNSKAVLKIDGDLKKMAEGWSQDELDAKRRLVQSRRSQSGSTITTSFKAVSPEERSPHSICVSCILCRLVTQSIQFN
jgi:hypothetical protein